MSTPTLAFLTDLGFDRIQAALQAAFADYAVDMGYMTVPYLEQRSRKNGVDLSLSPGVFVDGQLVGLTLVGTGPWQGGLGAFDAGTGLVKAWRGQGLASAMFDFALPALRARGIDTFVLEVLQENAPAIRAYEKAGFAITRELDCLERAPAEGLVPTALPAGFHMARAEAGVLEVFEREAAWPLSWECSFEAQRRLEEAMVLQVAYEGTEPVGLAAFCPELGWLMALQVRAGWRRRGLGSALLTRVLRDHAAPGQRIRADNILATDGATRAVLEHHGFTLAVSQFEMTRPLT